MPNCPPGKQNHFILSQAWCVSEAEHPVASAAGGTILLFFCHLNTRAAFLSSAGVDMAGWCWHSLSTGVNTSVVPLRCMGG